MHQRSYESITAPRTPVIIIWTPITARMSPIRRVTTLIAFSPR